MSLSSKTIIPSTAFRHVSIMVFFMSLLTGFCGFGFIITGSTVKAWQDNVNNIMTVDILNYDDNAVISQDIIETQTQSIIDRLKTDPTVVDIQEYAPQNDFVTDTRFEIAVPQFLTVTLAPERAQNTEERLAKIIHTHAPQANIRMSTDWNSNINDTAQLFTMVLGGLMVAILAVSLIIISGIVRSQLSASMDTVRLVHLIGASGFDITRLFQNAINIAVLKGCTLSSVALLIILQPFMYYTGYMGTIEFFLIAIAFIPIVFLILSMIVTYYTVFMALRTMP